MNTQFAQEDPIQKRLEAHGIQVPAVDTYQRDARNLVDPIAERLRAHGIDASQGDLLPPEALANHPPLLSSIASDSDFRALSPGDQLSVRRKYYHQIVKDPDYQALSTEDRHDIAKKVLGRKAPTPEIQFDMAPTPASSGRSVRPAAGVFERQLAAEEALRLR